MVTDLDAHETLKETSTPRLIAEIAEQARALAQKQWELALVELEADVASDLSALRRFGLAAVVGLLGLSALVTAGVLALSLVMPVWLSGLVIAAPLLAAAGVTAFVAYRRVEAPLARTRRALRKDVALAREHLTRGHVG